MRLWKMPVWNWPVIKERKEKKSLSSEELAELVEHLPTQREEKKKYELVCCEDDEKKKLTPFNDFLLMFTLWARSVGKWIMTGNEGICKKEFK